MDIDQIKTFIAVYRANSFVDVARHLNVAPSSISRSIGSLETRLGVRLFQRTTRVLTPTQAGDAYFERMVPLIEEMDQVHANLIDESITPAGSLRVTASASYGEIVVAPKLHSFRESYPEIELELVLSDGQVDLINDRIDIAIRHGKLEDSTLVAKKLCDVSYALVASPTYLATRSIPATPAELSEHDIVTFSYEAYRAAWLFRQRKTSHTFNIEPAIRMTNASAILAGVRHGLGISLLADWTVSDDIAAGRLVRLMEDWEISGTSPHSALWAVYPSRKYVPAKTHAFVDFLSEISNVTYNLPGAGS